MSKIYDALSELEAKPFEANHGAAIEPPVRASANGLAKELVEFETLLFDRIARLRVAADSSETAAANQSQQSTQTIEKLKSQIIALDSRLKETKELVESKDLANQVLERDMSAKVNELQGEIKKKDESLLSRVAEVNALKSEVNRLREGIHGMVSVFNQQAQALGGQPAGSYSLAGLAQSSAAETGMSTSPQSATPPSMFAVPEAGSNDVVERTIFER